MTSFSFQRKKTTNPYYFDNKSDLDTQINTSDMLQNKQITSTPAIMVRHDRVQFREKERKIKVS